MRTLIRALVVALLGLVTLALPAAAQESVTITLREQRGSGQSGTAILTAVGNQTRVVVTLSNPPAGGGTAGAYSRGYVCQPQPAATLSVAESDEWAGGDGG